MRLYNVHTLLETERLINKHFSIFEVETIDINECYHRILGEDIYASIDVPSFNRSTVDGYAVKSTDTHGASETMPILLQNIGSVEMGQAPNIQIKDDTCCYVPTGGYLPPGANAMVMIEYTEKYNEEIAILSTATPLQNIIHSGDDVKSGSQILKKGTRLTSRHIGVLAAAGIFSIPVYKRLKVLIISTGDELVTEDQKLNLGEVFDINTHTIKNHCRLFDLEVIACYVLKDKYQLIKEKIDYGIKNADITIVSGGSSVGHKDFTADIIDELAGGDGVMIHGLAIKPGKPTIIGKVNHKLVLGLPGHPVSALIVFDQIMRMYLKEQYEYKANTTKGILNKNIHAAPGKETFIMVNTDNGVEPILGKSGMITMLSAADGYVKIGANEEGLSVGDFVTIYKFE